MEKVYIFILLYFTVCVVYGQEIQITEEASLEQVYGEAVESKNLLSFNDLNVEFGYILYEAKIVIVSEESVLELENVRDYVAIYIDNKLQGTMTDNDKKVTLAVVPGEHTLQLYAENIGRITYGPEILDNSKGLFGSITLDGEEIETWKITPLNIRESDVNSLQFAVQQACEAPGFHKGYFTVTEARDIYVDISGWGMGEVWINGEYIGSYWENEKQQSIQVSASTLKNGKNEVVVFELKNNCQKTIKLSGNPVFK